ncbi:MAG: hypothetical protein R6V83_08405 [Candidatus Thorarchaeota archaeon]
MIGKWIGNAGILLIVIMVAVLFGTKLLASLTVIVLSARTGNVIPLLFLVLLAFGLLVLDHRFVSESKVSSVVTAVAGFAAGYSALAIGFTLLIFDGLVSILGVIFFLIGCTTVRNPHRQKRSAKVLSRGFSTVLNTMVRIEDNHSVRSGSVWQVFLLSHRYFQTMITLIEERPLLPVCLVRFEEADAIIVNCENDAGWPNRIKNLVRSYGVDHFTELSPEVSHFIGSLPYLESLAGIDPKDFRIATNHTTLSRILADPPVRTTILPSSDGPRVIVRENEVPGMDLESLPPGTEETLLFEKDVSVIIRSVTADGQTAE